MDGTTFDRLTRMLGGRLSRRAAAVAAGVAGVAGVAALAGPSAEAAPDDRCRSSRQTRCRGKCVNTNTSKQHCGRCNRACAANERCRRGRCKPKAAKVCGSGGPCIVFVTSTQSTGAMGGLIGADSACNAAAFSTALPGTYMAWLSDDTNSPATRFTRNPGPYVTPNGILIARNWSALTSDELRATISETETGAGATSVTFTNTLADGTIADAANTCQNWTSSSFGDSSTVSGNNTETDSDWTAQPVPVNCGLQQPIYCFQQTA